MQTNRRYWPIVLVLLGALSVAGCAEDEADPQQSEIPELQVTCSGKCDGWGSIKSLWDDRKKVDLNDLVNVAAGFATDELNGALDVTDYASISLGPPELYALSEKAAEDLTLNDIETLVSGLAARYGERELTTEVNFVRRSHLVNSQDVVFAESKFRIESSLDPRWNIETGGFGANVTLGFDAGVQLEARVINAFDSELKATGGAPLSAIREARGFILPRSVQDLRDMSPGESFALSGEGSLGLNLGVGVPLLIAEPISALSYSFVISGALRTHLSGTLDVQLVRLDGDEIVLDVGVSKASVRSASVALDDEWGVAGLLESVVDVAGIEVDLGELVDKALRKQMNAKLDLISARASSSTTETRLSVARLRFDLTQVEGDASPAGQAIAQALRGDVRLAQALAYQQEAGVTAEFDLSRSGLSATSYAGIDLLGMSFFRDVAESTGTVVIQTPGGARSLFFDSLHQESGWFFSSHGYGRIAIAGLVFDPVNPQNAPRGETNLFLQVVEGDDHMERDKIVDHLDALILGLGGPDALAAIESSGNTLQRYVIANCPADDPFADCRTDILSDPEVVSLRMRASADLVAAIDLDSSLVDLVVAAGDLRLAAQATVEPNALLVGPETSVVLDYRLDDGALTQILINQEPSDFRDALARYIEVVAVDRSDDPNRIAEDRAEAVADATRELDAMVEVFTRHSDDYRRLVAAEQAAVDTLGVVGPRALEIRFGVSSDNRPLYEEATAQSLPQARAMLLTRLWDELIDAADGLDDTHAEQAVAYALMSMTPRDRADVRLNIDMDLDDGFSQNFEHYRQAGWGPFDLYGRGPDVETVDGGLFDVNALIAGP